jgi:nicotinamidase-related amidase
MMLFRTIALAVILTAVVSAQGGAKGTTMGPDTALVVVDIQNFYFEQGLVPLTGSVEAEAQASRVLNAFRAKRLPIIHVRHVPASVAIVDGEPTDPQYRIRAAMIPVAGEKIISKRYANSFRDTDLLEYLREKSIKKLVIVGMQTHMCVEAASRAATDLGFDVTVVHDACATRPLEFAGQKVPAALVHATALSAINGTYGRVISVEQLLKELQLDPG